MKNLVITLICVALYGSALSQPLTIEYVDNWIGLCEPQLDLSKKEKLYIIEGVPYEGTELNEKLSTFNASNKLLLLDYLNSDSVETTFLKPNLIVVLIQNARKSKLKQRKKQLADAQYKFVDRYDFKLNHIITNSKDPVLYIDDKKIHHSEAKKVINELVVKEIQHIVITNHAPTSIYGANARNGLVKIWTK